jgi:hypothetical protein
MTKDKEFVILTNMLNEGYEIVASTYVRIGLRREFHLTLFPTGTHPKTVAEDEYANMVRLLNEEYKLGKSSGLREGDRHEFTFTFYKR